jgi:beta-lactamase superfamily II metal-dependent hydrolase
LRREYYCGRPLAHRISALNCGVFTEGSSGSGCGSSYLSSTADYLSSMAMMPNKLALPVEVTPAPPLPPLGRGAVKPKQKFLAIVAGYGDERIYDDVSLFLRVVAIPGTLDVNEPSLYQMKDGQLAEFFQKVGGAYDNLQTGGISCSVSYNNADGAPASLALLIDPTITQVKATLTEFFDTGLYHVLYYGGHGTEDGWSINTDDGSGGAFTRSDFEELCRSRHGISGQVYLNCCDANKWVQNVTGGNREGRINGDKMLPAATGSCTQLAAGNRGMSRRSVNSVDGSQDKVGLRYFALKEANVPIDNNKNPLATAIKEHFRVPNAMIAGNFLDVVDAFRSVVIRALVSPPPAPVNEFALHYFPNTGGIGDCFLLCAEKGECKILVDGLRMGNFRDVAWPVLGGIARFDLVIGTHRDRDHVGGLCLLVDYFPGKIGKLWVNHTPEEPAFRSVPDVRRIYAGWDRPKEKREPLKNTYSGATWPSLSRRTEVLVISPEEEYYKDNCQDGDREMVNDLSIASVIYNCANGRRTPMVLLPGDCSATTILTQLTCHNLQDKTFELVVLPHHGSDDSNSWKGKDGKVTWLHRLVEAKRYLINGHDKSHPGKALCKDMDLMLSEKRGRDVSCYVAGGGWKFEEDYKPLAADKVHHMGGPTVFNLEPASVAATVSDGASADSSSKRKRDMSPGSGGSSVPGKPPFTTLAMCDFDE